MRHLTYILLLFVTLLAVATLPSTGDSAEATVYNPEIDEYSITENDSSTQVKEGIRPPFDGLPINESDISEDVEDVKSIMCGQQANPPRCIVTYYDGDTQEIEVPYRPLV